MQQERNVEGGETVSRRCNVIDLGRTEYGHCLRLQHALLQLRQNSMICDTLLLTEHDPVVTFGRGFRGELPSLPVPAFQIERGGEGTYHAPGQLVAYPILNLMENDIGIRTLVSRVLGAAVTALREQGISSEARFEPVGVWAGEKKIASLGIAVKRWVTFHGVAVNLNNSLEGFHYISPCGMSPSMITSAHQLLGREVDFNAVSEEFVDAFMNVFGFAAEYRRLGDMPLPSPALM